MQNGPAKPYDDQINDAAAKIPGKDPVTFDFGQALILLKQGKKVKRLGWNAGDQYIYHVPAAEYPAQTEIAKAEFGDVVPYTAYLAIKTVQRTVAPWLASQTDVLAEDWTVAE